MIAAPHDHRFRRQWMRPWTSPRRWDKGPAMSVFVYVSRSLSPTNRASVPRIVGTAPATLDVLQGVRIHGVDASRAVDAHRREAGVTQYLEVLRHRRLRDGKLAPNDFGDLARRMLSLCKETPGCAAAQGRRAHRTRASGRLGRFAGVERGRAPCRCTRRVGVRSDRDGRLPPTFAAACDERLALR